MKTEAVSISTKEKISLITNLSTMLAAGIPILEVIESLVEEAKGNQRKLLTTLRNDIIQGNRMHTSFAKFPKIFDKVTINLIRAAEEAGTLQTTLNDIKENIKKETEFNDKIKAALMYPILILIVFFGIMLLILIVVIPKIATIFSRLKVTLPLPTKILIFTSQLLLNYTLPLLLGIGLLIGGVFYLFRNNKMVILKPLYRLPLISGLIRQIDLTHLTRSLYLLLYSGITLTNALELTQDIVFDKEIAKTVSRSKTMVLSGKKPSEGFKSTKGVIPSLMIKLLEAGERSGSLEKAMKDLSEYFDYEVTNTLKTVVILLEPLLLVAIALFVGSIMIAIIAPIYGLIGQIGAR